MRPLTPDDEGRVLQTVLSLYHENPRLRGFDWPPEDLRGEFRSAEGWGVFKSNRLAAFVLFRTNPAAWDISVVASHPEFQRQGLMRSLLSHLIVVKPASKELWLEVHSENTGAWKLYESLGFVKVGERPRYYPDGGTAWLYCLR